MNAKDKTFIRVSGLKKVEKFEVIDRTAQLPIGFYVSILWYRIRLITSPTINALRSRCYQFEITPTFTTSLITNELLFVFKWFQMVSNGFQMVFKLFQMVSNDCKSKLIPYLEIGFPDSAKEENETSKSSSIAGMCSTK